MLEITEKQWSGNNLNTRLPLSTRKQLEAAIAETPSVTPELRAEAEEIGCSWGEEEASLWRETHDSRLPAWTMGTYCGRLPGLDDQPADSDEWMQHREVVDAIIDFAARDAWEAGMDRELRSAR